MLVGGCLLLYTFLSAYWRHYLPIAVPSAFASQLLAYILLHAVVFAPLVLGTILTTAQERVRYAEVWVAPAVSIGVIILILIRELGRFALATALRPWPLYLVTTLFYRGMPAHDFGFYLLNGLYLLNRLLSLLAAFLLSVRLILILPLLALGKAGWRKLVFDAWRMMRGHYGFALAVSIAALLPIVVGDYFLGRLYASLSRPSGLSVLPAIQWEALLIRSTELTLDYIVMAALASGLYLAIRAGSDVTIGSSERPDPLPLAKLTLCSAGNESTIAMLLCFHFDIRPRCIAQRFEFAIARLARRDFGT